jgi:hypothetical protein
VNDSDWTRHHRHEKLWVYQLNETDRLGVWEWHDGTFRGEVLRLWQTTMNAPPQPTLEAAKEWVWRIARGEETGYPTMHAAEKAGQLAAAS